MKRILIFILSLLSVVSYSQIIVSGIDTVVNTYQGLDYDANDSGTLLIKNNRVAQTWSEGQYILKIGEDSYYEAYALNFDHPTIVGNYFDYNNDTASDCHGILAGYNANFNIRYNYIDNSGYGIVYEGGYDDGTPIVNTDTTNIRGNILRNTYIGIHVCGYQNVVINNNTIYQGKTTDAQAFKVDVSNGTTTPAYSKNVTIVNNIFYSKGTYAGMVSSGCDTNLVIDYNVYYFPNNANNEPIFHYLGASKTWAQWRALGFDTHSVIMDPEFSDTISFIPTAQLISGYDLGKYDYALTQESIWEVGSDIDTVQQGSTWNVGAVVSTVPSSTAYYVVSSGSSYNGMNTPSDSNDGSFANPWATIQYAFNTATAGDTVYFRGGTWYPDYTPRHNPPTYGSNGTYNNWIVFANYPDEVPIIDGTNYPTTSSTGVGLSMYYSDYIKFKGFIIQNVLETTDEQVVKGGSATYVGTVAWEDVTARYIGGHGFQWAGYDTIYVTRCDSYENADINNQGNRADGFAGGSGGSVTDTFKVAYYTDCRAWRNSDDGFDFGTTKQFQVSNCWSFSNGYWEEGTGIGFKTNPSNVTNPHKRRIANCLSAYNRLHGYQNTNLNDTIYGPVAEFINNTSYQNYEGFNSSIGDFVCDSSYAIIDVIYRNNVVYHSKTTILDQYDFGTCDEPTSPEFVTQDHNTWITKATGSFWGYDTINGTTWAYSGLDDQFVDILDSTECMAQMAAPRKADGSLPDITFMKLAFGSVLIDAGVDVGLPYTGAAPDMGYAEYEVILDTTPPSIPTGLDTTSVTYNTVNLTWNASTGSPEYYIVYRDGDSIASPTNTTYSDVGLDSNTEYEYYLRARDDSMNTSNPSDTLTVTTKIATDSIIVTTGTMLQDSISNNRQIGDIIFIDADAITDTINIDFAGLTIKPAAGRTPTITGRFNIIADSTTIFKISFSNLGGTAIYANTNELMKLDSCVFIADTALYSNKIDSLNFIHNQVDTGRVFIIPPLTDWRLKNQNIDYNTYDNDVKINNKDFWLWRDDYPNVDQNSSVTSN